MSTVNAITIYAENLNSANLIVGNTSSNLVVVANSISVKFGTNLTINSTAINVVSPTTPAQNVTINSTSFSANTLKINGQDYNGVVDEFPLVDYQVFTSTVASNYWYKPIWAEANDLVTIMMWGGGGGGAGNSTFILGGGGGACVVVNKLVGECNSVCNVVVGAGGTGATTTAAATGGGTSSFWTNSTFSISSYGGGAANGTTNWIGGGGGGWFSAGSNGLGGGPLGATVNGASSTFGGGAGGNGSINPAGSSIYGGGGGHTYAVSGATAIGGSSIYGGGGGGNTPGTSIYGGNGGISNSTNVNINGNIPAGGAGANSTIGGNGARGEVRVWVTSQRKQRGDILPYYFITPQSTLIYSGNNITFDVTTVNVANGTTLYYTLNNSSTATSADFTTAVNGSVIMNGGANSFTLTVNSSSQNKSFYLDLRTVSSSGSIVANTDTISIYPPQGQQLFTSNGSFVVPAGVTKVSIVAVGAGGSNGGGGGALSYTNDVSVTPSETLTVLVGLASGARDTSIARGATTLVLAKGGSTSGAGGAAASGVGAVRQSGGAGGGKLTQVGGGGGAAGYSGSGGSGASPGGNGGSSGSGGGGGGGCSANGNDSGKGGGGVGLSGEGASGSGGARGPQDPGYGGSGGENGTGAYTGDTAGRYGGGGGGSPSTEGLGANGALRIIWGANRAFPNTNTTDV